MLTGHRILTLTLAATLLTGLIAAGTPAGAGPLTASPTVTTLALAGNIVTAEPVGFRIFRNRDRSFFGGDQRFFRHDRRDRYFSNGPRFDRRRDYGRPFDGYRSRPNYYYDDRY